MKLAAADRPGWGLVSGSLAITGIIMTAGVSLFPFILPSRTDPNSSLIVWDAVSSHLTLTVMFWAAVIFIPLILAYTTWTYAKMWRRVTVEEIREQEHLATKLTCVVFIVRLGADILDPSETRFRRENVAGPEPARPRSHTAPGAV
jgi:hypothetical protein